MTCCNIRACLTYLADCLEALRELSAILWTPESLGQAQADLEVIGTRATRHDAARCGTRVLVHSKTLHCFGFGQELDILAWLLTDFIAVPAKVRDQHRVGEERCCDRGCHHGQDEVQHVVLTKPASGWHSFKLKLLGLATTATHLKFSAIF